MGTLVLNLLFISVIISFIIDCSGIVDSVKSMISRYILNIRSVNYSIKPFDCSLCMTWWTGLIYIYWIGQFSIIGVFIVALFSYFSSHISLILMTVKDIIGLLINKIINYINEI